MIFNERVRQLRLESGETQEQVAAQVAMTTRAYQRMEADAKPRYDTLRNLAEHFQVSVDWLMGRTEKREVNR